MAEQFLNKRKDIKPGSWFEAIFAGMQPKTAKKARNHSKEGPINTSVGKSGFETISFVLSPQTLIGI